MDLTLEAYADQLKRARQMSGLAAMLPAGASAALGGAEGTKALTAMLTQHEAIIRCVGGRGSARALRRALTASAHALLPPQSAHARGARRAAGDAEHSGDAAHRGGGGLHAA